MSRAFVKDSSDERWHKPQQNHTPEFAVYRAVGASSFDPEPLRRGEDFADLLRWAANQPVGHLQVRDRAGRRLADLPDPRSRRR